METLLLKDWILASDAAETKHIILCVSHTVWIQNYQNRFSLTAADGLIKL
jgi:hypothetical protein